MQRRVLSASAALAAAVATAGGFHPRPQPPLTTYCEGAEEARAHTSGEDGGPPRFTAAF
jgi:hypothetical protein